MKAIVIVSLLCLWNFSLGTSCGSGVLFGQEMAPEVGVGESDSSQKLKSLVFEQEANGLPNQPTTDAVIQRLMVAKDRLRLDDPTSGVTYLLQLLGETPKVYEVSSDGNKYREAEEHGGLQAARDRAERQTLDRLGETPRMEREAILRELHLRPGLKREVVVEWPGEEKTLLGRQVRKMVVEENGRVVVEAWMAEEPFDIPFFDFYRQLGAFSEAVLEKLNGVKGIPLEVDFTVVTASLSYPIEVSARRLEVMEIAVIEYEVPSWSKKIVESPFAACPICGKQVEKAAPPGGRGKARSGLLLYFCSRHCKLEYLKQKGIKVPGREN